MADENIVKRACRELGITQKELAERMGVAEQTVRNWSATSKTPEWGNRFIFTLLRVQELERKKDEDNTLKVLKDFKGILESI